MGRIRRSDFAIRMFLIIILDLILFYDANLDNISAAVFAMLLVISLKIFQIILRLHDINKSGWYSLLIFVPILNLISLALFFVDGTIGGNKYGPDPKYRRISEKNISTSKEVNIPTEDTFIKISNSNVQKREVLKEKQNDHTRKNEILKIGRELNILSEEEFEKKKYELKKEKVKTENENKALDEQLLNENARIKKVMHLKTLLEAQLLTIEEYSQKLQLLNSGCIESMLDLDSKNLEISKANNLFGFEDNTSKELIVPHRFEDAFPFNEGLSAVIYNGKRGFIDSKGKFIIPPVYDKSGTYFKNGFAEVYFGGIKLIISKNGAIQQQLSKI